MRLPTPSPTRSGRRDQSPRMSKAAIDPSGCSSTTSISSCMSSHPRRAGSTGSHGSVATAKPYTSRPRPIVPYVVQTFRSANGPSILRSAADALLSVILAPSCAACRELLEHPTRGPVCGPCWRSILPLTPPLCHRCGDPLPSWRVISVPLAQCPRCRRRPPAVTHAAAIGPYDGALRAVVHAIKYDSRRSLARPLAALMRQRCASVLEGADLLVPVPLHPSRLRSRGFNQARDLAG